MAALNKTDSHSGVHPLFLLRIIKSYFAGIQQVKCIYIIKWGALSLPLLRGRGKSGQRRVSRL